MKTSLVPFQSRRVLLRLLAGLASHLVVVDAYAAIDAGQRIDDSQLPADLRERLAARLPAFFGNELSDYLPVMTPPSRQKVAGKEPLAEQFLRVFPGVPITTVRLSTGHILVGGAQPHNGDTKAFVVTLGDGAEVLAAALLHRNCGAPLRPGQETSCTPVPLLTVFFKATTPGDDELSKSIVRGVMLAIREFNEIVRDVPDMQVRQIGVKVRRIG